MTGPWCGQTWQGRLGWAFVAIGIALRLWQFMGGASLYLDEIALGRNIAERGYAELLKPLDYGQVAPAGFLLASRVLWSLFETDWSLRILPLVAAVASVVLFYRLATSMLVGWAVPVATGAFALGVPFIAYGSMVKPYSLDVALAVLLLLMAGELLSRAGTRYRQAVWCGVAGALAVWMSLAALLVTAGIALACLWAAHSRTSVERRLIVWAVVVPWGISAVAAGLAGLAGLGEATSGYMKGLWHGADAFLPFPPTNLAELLWPWRALESAFSGPGGLGWPIPALFAGLTLFGLWHLFRTRRTVALLLLGPPLVAFTASGLDLYPVSGRLALFLTPGWLIGMAAGLGGLGELLVPVRPRAGLAVATLGIVGPIAALAARPPVYRLQEARPLLQWVSARRLPSDPVFVWYRAAPNVRWYGRSSGLLSGEIIWGGCWLGEPRRFLRELDQLRGKPRAWLIIAGSGSSAVGLLLRYADSLGSRREQTRVVATLPGYFPMEAMLYDFSDSDRLSRFSAETFPMGQVQAPAQAVQACNLGPVVARAERAPATPGRAP